MDRLIQVVTDRRDHSLTIAEWIKHDDKLHELEMWNTVLHLEPIIIDLVI